jgi:Tfp pilus assembly protein PilX
VDLFQAKRLRREDGIALVLSLGITVVLIIFVASMIDYTTSNSRAATRSSGDLIAKQYAVAGLNTAHSMLVNQKVISGGNPTAANLLGCNGLGGAADINLYGYYSGTNPTIFNGVSVGASTWLLMSASHGRTERRTSAPTNAAATEWYTSEIPSPGTANDGSPHRNE